MRQAAAGDSSRETFDCNTKLLEWNPEFYTVWTHRRNILLVHLTRKSHSSLGEKPVNEHLSSELEFLIPLLRKYPKCYWIWRYRRWVLGQASTCYVSAPDTLNYWKHELHLVSKMLAQDSRNFHAWGYRRTVIEEIEYHQMAELDRNRRDNDGHLIVVDLSTSPEECSDPDKDTAPEIGPATALLTQQEFDYTTKMINTNLSNFSAWHHRSQVILKLLDEQEADAETRRKVLDSELEFVQRALYTGDNDQSPWFYHQYLMCTFDPVYAVRSLAPALTDNERATYAGEELEKLKEMLDGAEDNKWIYQAMLQLVLLSKRLTSEWLEEKQQVREWLGQLQKLDPLRAGRWRDLGKQLKIGEQELPAT